MKNGLKNISFVKMIIALVVYYEKSLKLLSRVLVKK